MKKITIAIIVLTIVSLTVYVNTETKQAHKKKLSYTSAELLQNEIDEKVQRRKQGYAKPDKPDKYIEYLNSLRSGFGKKDYEENYKLIAYKEALANGSLLKSTQVDLPWEQRGPGNVGGRTRAIITDPSDPKNIWFAGSVSGGIWKTTDAGENWALISPDMPNLSISSMAMSPSNNDVIYAGTGEGFYNIDAVRGQGIFKSTDRGATWNQLSSTATGSAYRYINSIIVSSTDQNKVWAATNYAVVVSTDGGVNWFDATPEQGNFGRYQRIIKHPSNDEILWVSGNDKGIFKTVNGGKDWYMVKDLTGEGRVELAVSSKNPDVLYALNENSKLYFSTDGGEEWATAVESGEATEFLSGQGWYNNVLAVNPNDEFKGFIGGLDFHEFSLGNDVTTGGKIAYKVSIDSNISSLIQFDNFQGTHAGGGAIFFTDYNVNNNISIEFGTGKTQKSHRLIHQTNNSNLTNVISDDKSNLSYQDYVDVPFKVKNNTTGTALAVSFIDANENGIFDLYDKSYEPIIIHSATYNSTSSNTQIVSNNGNALLIAAIYPQIVSGQSWNANSLPTGSIQIDTYTLKDKVLAATQKTYWNDGKSSSTYSHADHHNITIIPEGGSPFAILVGNDGGLSYSTDGGTNWNRKVNGYVTSQFYGVSRHPSQYQYFGGLQDNGSVLSGVNPNKLSSWSEVLGGDGFEVVWHSREPNKMIGSIYNNELYVTDDGGATWLDKTDFIGDNTSDSAPFYTRIASTKLDPELVFVGGESGLWKSEDFGLSWKNINMGNDWGYRGSAPSISISLANPDVIWAGNVMNQDANYDTGKIQVSTDGGETFTPVPVAFDLGVITNIVTHPNDEKTAYALFSYSDYPKIFRTTDLGQTWEDISGFFTLGNNNQINYGAANSNNGFPDVAVNTLLVMPFNDQEIWVGTEIGLFISSDNGATWQYSNNGLPAVSIWDMKIVGDEIVLGTHGLGVWTLKRNELSNELKNPFIVDVSVNPEGDYVFNTTIDVDMDKLEIYLDDKLQDTKTNITAGSRIDTIFKKDYNQEKRLRVIAYQGAEKLPSNVKEMPVNEFLEPISSYSNDFSTELTDFFGEGFSINSQNLDNNAIVTPHPYAQNQDFYYYLKYPIVVSETKDVAFISYDDIAFVETGENGASYPSDDFYDYVVIEATTDGLNWQAIEPGYDFNYSTKWSASGGDYEGTPSSSLYVNHKVSLYEKFAGKTILLRFKLHSDPYTTGWGWAVDNIRIQSEASGIFNKSENTIDLNLYPNPVYKSFTLEFENEYKGNLDIFIRDLSGKEVYRDKYFKEFSKFSELILPTWPSKGIYIVTIRIKDENSSKMLIVK